MSTSIVLEYIDSISKLSEYKFDKEYIKYRLDKDTAISFTGKIEILRLINLIKKWNSGDTSENIKDSIVKGIEALSDPSTDEPTANKNAALRWLKLNEQWIKNEDVTDKMGRAIRSKVDSLEKDNNNRIETITKILSENPEIKPPIDLKLGLAYLTAESFLRRAIIYIEHGWNHEWDANQVSNSVHNEYLNSGFYATFQEAKKVAIEHGGGTLIRNPNGWTVKK